jgi:hypothetical protein
MALTEKSLNNSYIWLGENPVKTRRNIAAWLTMKRFSKYKDMRREMGGRRASG